ncbi:cytochrome c biogenesis heme-transporting ATPase CcmA [Halioxenophilus sp. WMMB6]|uniref:cytochrome c biogenesis heme-transporting ATPase CcmA n=1 Tax=Halioxenophilus sp. WMMB6 TaxID=3073815 RepID=UPI00295EE433|nr:cytochrome c biogenesis heme-transporting ATPase CcmA [Halioxenophilus sp. WMMB6]
MVINLELVNLECEREDRILFTGLSQRLSGGDVVQIEGPNGSGKTTLLRVLTTLSNDYSGEIHWCGQPLQRVKYDYLQQLLYIGHLPGVKKNLSPLENLRWYASVRGGQAQSTLETALAAVGLLGFEDVPCFQLSAGQQRRAALARLYLNPPPLWILDEPFTAIDKRGVSALEDLISQHAERGGLTVLTTHQDMKLANLVRVNLTQYRPGARHE